MARNSEKNLSELNRLYLAKQKEIEERTNKERPPLMSLNSASDIKKWIPSIKSDIFYCVRHMSGIRNYSDSKIREFQERLESLKKEYKRWVGRCLQLDPNTIGVPGEKHAYVSKKILAQQDRADVRKRSRPSDSLASQYNLKLPDGISEEEFDEMFAEDRPDDLQQWIEETLEENEEGDETDEIVIATPLLNREASEPSKKPKTAESYTKVEDESQNRPLVFVKESHQTKTVIGKNKIGGLALLSGYASSDGDDS
eukprot:TRINITY_DN4663_c0_g1_i1.p1 TRINITY_DN4663_c0_g1~~TRINITY_DN4663_c0_g1_i1.p1  ORF type:complete len:255 (+),score=42.89 TRINITY_DN4663_c0_g1_i1:76-840(+)